MNAVISSTSSPGEALSLLRAHNPLVQCITNSVVTGFTANVLLALGATPAMVDIPAESGLFASIADGVLVNLGTPTSEQRAAAAEVPAATRRWVLDPVAIGVLPVRTALASQLLAGRPAIVRGNASEILALAGTGEGGRGVDATDSPETALAAATTIARRSGAVVAVSGPVDIITDGAVIVRVHGGDALLTRVTGGGCSLGAVMAAFLGVCTPLSSAVAASAVYAAASETAAARADGPGSFAVGFLDALAALEPSSLEEPGRVVRHPLDASAIEALR
ncbi:hydroxyethylthiazole kinase [Brooklawnia cerclae]|uniref:Hydroxyethylthiazole kinase n=1 Tax=Brooklawnia cerclae TaxID=349934 RepID=A0ABX0SE80_9ACTN|nr:hydroxyethylthiazole kinase [Brooklawnia cerclae]NIH56690.1 hydroxyethylthiazole kinase [Brooklawnia cerclae]